MKHKPECVPCLLNRVLFQSKLTGNGRESESMEAALKTYWEMFYKESNSARIATMVHKSSYDALGIRDPYFDLKQRADNTAMRYIERIKKFIDDSEDRFRAAVKVAILGNIMDFGAGIAIESPEEFDGIFESLLKMELAIDDTQRVMEILRSSSSIIYIFDNCGEALFDIPLIQQIRNMGVRVIGVVRGEPILNDITLEDANRIGLKDHLDLILTTGTFSIGVDIRYINDELRKEMDDSDLMIAKGMANFESLSDELLGVPTAYLLKAKCIPVASEFGVEVGSNIAKLVP